MNIDKFQGIYEAYGRADVATIAVPNAAKFDSTDSHDADASAALAQRRREGARALFGVVAVGLGLAKLAVKELWRGL